MCSAIVTPALLPRAEKLGDACYYTLGYPNLEISQSFSYWLVRSMVGVPNPELSKKARNLGKWLVEEA